MSSLPRAQFCGLAPKLESEFGVGRAADLSSAFHASCAEAPETEKLMKRLTDEEMQEIMQWHRPTDVTVEEGVVLQYAYADKELTVGLDEHGAYTDDESVAVSWGHLDMAWVVELDNRRIAYVADIKRSEYTVEEGPDSLQLHAYGLAYASKHNCDGYVLGIWGAVEGTWWWGEYVDLYESPWETVKAAALNQSERASTGIHCRSCYGRMHCPEYLMPAIQLVTIGGSPESERTQVLADFMEPGGLNAGNALTAFQLYKSADDLVKIMKKQIMEYVRRHGIEDPEKGKTYKMIQTRGREGVSVKALRESMGKDAEKHIKRGGGFDSPKWVNS